jgi:hypothetical protein
LSSGNPTAHCTRPLHLSELAAYGRIEAARTARRVPDILSALADGSLTLTTVGLLAPHLNAENQSALIEATRQKSKRDVERVIAALRPLGGLRKLLHPAKHRKPLSAADGTAGRRGDVEQQESGAW